MADKYSGGNPGGVMPKNVGVKPGDPSRHFAPKAGGYSPGKTAPTGNVPDTKHSQIDLEKHRGQGSNLKSK